VVWPFKKKPEPLRRFEIADVVSAAGTLKEQVEEQVPNGRAQIVIALWHLRPIMIVNTSLAKDRGYSEYDIRHMMGSLQDAMPQATGEIDRRRVGWFFIAGTLYYLCHFGGEPPQQMKDDLADIFIMLADATYVIPNIVEHNIIWKDEEKEPFKDGLLGTKRDVLCNMTPPYLRTHQKLAAYAKQHGFLYDLTH